MKTVFAVEFLLFFAAIGGLALFAILMTGNQDFVDQALSFLRS